MVLSNTYESGGYMHKVENLSVCANCGGKCCKNCGCDYFTTDFRSLKTENILKELESGRISIVAFLHFHRLKSGKIMCNPILLLRARNINRDVVDLLSFKTTCASLEDNRCHYDIIHRPSGGGVLKPSKDGNCYDIVDRNVELEKWKSFQAPLQRAVKKLTGKSVDEKLREDIINLVYKVLTQDYNDINPSEVASVKEMLPMLKEVYPQEFIKAWYLYKQNQPPVLSKNKPTK